MKALVFDGALRMAELDPPRRDDEALIRVRLAGICNTDIEITHGYKSFQGVLGHEFVGDVVESPNIAWLGKRVCGEINVACGVCRWCVRDLATHCANRTVLGILNRSGAFAEYLSLPVCNLHAVPDEVPDEEAVFVEPLAAAFEILEQIDVQHGDQVVVLGDGKLGLLCSQVLRLAGARVQLVGKHAEKLRLAASIGVETRFHGEIQDDAADIVVEATGSASGLEAAMAISRPRGTVVLKSTVAASAATDLSPIPVKELTVVGSRCGPFEPAMAALAAGKVRVAPMIEARYALSDAVGAMAHATAPGALKVLVDPLA